MDNRKTYDVFKTNRQRILNKTSNLSFIKNNFGGFDSFPAMLSFILWMFGGNARKYGGGRGGFSTSITWFKEEIKGFLRLSLTKLGPKTLVMQYANLEVAGARGALVGEPQGVDRTSPERCKQVICDNYITSRASPFL